MQGAVSYDRKIRVLDVLAPNSRKHFAVNFHLAIGAVVRGADAADSSGKRKKQDSRRGYKNGCLNFCGHLTPIEKAQLRRPELLPNYNWFDADLRNFGAWESLAVITLGLGLTVGRN